MINRAYKFAVLGGGHGGTAMAGHLSLCGIDVSLYNRGEDRIRAIKEGNGIEILSGNDNIPRGFARLETVTRDISEAIGGREIIMVVVPATGHRFIAEQLAPCLEDDQIVVLNPGRTGGALEVLNVLREKQCRANVVVCEAQTLLYASRSVNPAQTQIFRIKNSVPVASIPAHKTPQVVKMLRTALPQFIPGDNVMKTSLDNIGSIFHPAVTVLNAGRIESTIGDFEYYTDGITASVSLILERLDRERVSVAEALGFRVMTAREWLYVAYDSAGRTLFEAIRNNRGYHGIMAPKTIQHRYITEDVPMSLVPISSLGKFCDVETPVIDSIIQMASILHEKDYWKCGRTIEKMGLTGMSLKELRSFTIEGISEQSDFKNSEKRGGEL